MTVTAPTASVQSHWLYHTLAMVGIAVGIFIITAGVYLLIYPPSCCAGM